MKDSDMRRSKRQQPNPGTIRDGVNKSLIQGFKCDIEFTSVEVIFDVIGDVSIPVYVQILGGINGYPSKHHARSDEAMIDMSTVDVGKPITVELTNVECSETEYFLVFTTEDRNHTLKTSKGINNPQCQLTMNLF